MKLQAPRWWYRRNPAEGRLARALLAPLSTIWTLATLRRIARGRPLDPGVPVVCVGNLTVGGTGKTPVAREIAKMLRATGNEAHVLTRGYGGRLKGPIRVDPDRHGAEDVGDEPLMLARDLPVWVARDRSAGAQAAVAGGAQVLVMDDGHQNPSLSKTLSLVIVDAETRGGDWPFGAGGVVPAGPLREPLNAGLARADAVVLMLPADVAQADPELLSLLGDKPVLRARLEPDGPLPAGPLLAFAGIGKPWKFERALTAAGGDVREMRAFPDHHAFGEAELSALAKAAKRLSATLVTTEKDWTRLPAAWRSRVVAWPVRAVFEDNAALAALLS